MKQLFKVADKQKSICIEFTDQGITFTPDCSHEYDKETHDVLSKMFFNDTFTSYIEYYDIKLSSANKLDTQHDEIINQIRRNIERLNRPVILHISNQALPNEIGPIDEFKDDNSYTFISKIIDLGNQNIPKSISVELNDKVLVPDYKKRYRTKEDLPDSYLEATRFRNIKLSSLFKHTRLADLLTINVELFYYNEKVEQVFKLYDVLTFGTEDILTEVSWHTEIVRCQRNWDGVRLSPTQIHRLEYFINRPPQQQGQKYFNCIMIENDDAKWDLFKILHGEDKPDLVNYSNLQPQVLASLVVLWTSPHPDLCNNPSQTQFHSGFHSGIVNTVACGMGFNTSFTRCGPRYEEKWKEWLEKYNLSTLVHNDYLFSLGIGTGKDGAPYNEDHVNSQDRHLHVPIDPPTVDKI